MARRARNEILYDGCFAHIFSRSIEKRFIFQDHLDFEYFLAGLREAKKKANFRLHHYCLMNTHFHLLVSLPDLNAFSYAMKWLKWQYTAHFNERDKRQGPVWQERFKSQLIENENYLYACGLYVEMNPVEAGMASSPDEWLYSSSRHYLRGQADTLIDSYGHGDAPNDIEYKGMRDAFRRGHIIGSELFRLQFSDISASV